MERVASWVAVLTICGAVQVTRADDWPEWRGAGRLGVVTESGLVDTFPTGGLPVAWRTSIHSGYSGAAVAAGRVFITDAHRPDPRSTAVVERALALDEQTGQVLWTREWETDYAGLQLVYAIGPRATPTVDDDRVYVLGAMGHLLALDVATGDVVWQKDYARDFNTAVPSWGMTGAPLVDGDRLICLVGGEPDAKMMAFDKRTGEEIWRALSSDWEPGYSQPIIIEAGGARQLIAWHPRDISALNPETGEIYWEVRHIVDMGINPATPVQSGQYLFFTSQYGGARMLALDEATPGARVLWQGVGESDPEYGRDFNTLNSVISTPLIQGDYVYGVDGHGVLRCLEIATGRRVWETEALIGESTNWATAFFVRHADRYFINTDTGDLVIAELSPEGYREISRTHLIDPTHPYVRRRSSGPAVNWSHPAYANRHIVVRNDEEIVRLSLASGR
ncbi:MAG: PQQ-like beta-propeller repeat protein [Vicinamibacterales bacterium]|jgi:outer membrane protein assembly factor BamB|nr:PQQ-like beta-propeller repeat protein [Vicinamibacterales bacterium]